MKHIFICNPAAGRDNSAMLNALQEKLHEYDGKLDYEVYFTKAPGDATDYIKARLEKDAETPMRFYACGGDGTASEVLHGVIGHANASMTTYPCGSGNDYVKYYGTERFLDVDALIAGVEMPVDVMKIDDRYALNVTNFGFDTTVAQTMIKVKRKKIIGGKRAYVTGVVTALIKAMKTKCVVSVDGEALNEGKMLLCTVANGKYVGGSFCCAPRSLNDDGLLEVCLVRPISRITFVRLLGPYTRGEHLDDPRFAKRIVYRRGKSVHVKAEPGFAFSLDGEIVRKNDFTIEICPGALRYAVPAEKKPAAAEQEPQAAAN